MKKHKYLSFGLLLALGACGDERAATGGITSIGSALTAVSTQLAAVGSLGYDTSAVMMSRIKDAATVKRSSTLLSPMAGTAFGANWEAAGLINKGDSSNTSVSAKEFMGLQLDPDAVGDDGNGREFALNVFGRFESSMMIACALGELSTKDANGYPSNGTSEISLTPANLATLVAKCGMTQADADYMGEQETAPAITATVTDATDDSVYDKKIVMQLDESMGGAVQTFLLRFNANVVNILNVEDGTYDSRTIVAYDVATKVLKVEYYSGGADSFWYYRLYYDATNDEGRLVGTLGGTNNYNRYALAGKPNTAGTFALSFVSYNGSTTYDHNACVDNASGDIPAGGDGSLECSVTGTDLADASFDWIDTAFTNRADAGWVSAADETRTANWTVDTTFTVAAQY